VRLFLSVSLVLVNSIVGVARADDLRLFENCMQLKGVLANTSLLFMDDHNPDLRIQNLPDLAANFDIYSQIAKIAGGPEAKAVIEAFEVDESNAIIGNVFAAQTTMEIAQCKLPTGGKHSCGPIHLALEKSVAGLATACANDFRKAQN